MRRLGPLLPACTVTLAAMLAFRRFGDADSWWHLASGRWIAEHRAIPHTDVLSYTVPDHPWINLQWLFDLFVYGLHRAGGPTVLVLAGAVLYGAAIALLLKNLRPSLGPVASAMLGLWVLAIAQERFSIRPEMASYLLLQVVLFVCATGTRAGGRRLWLLPAVMTLWVNTHGLFVIGVFVIGCYMAAAVAGRLSFLPPRWRDSLEPSAVRTMLLSGALALLATLANPYGLEGTLFPVKLMTHISGESPAFLLVGELRRSFSPENVTFAGRAYKGLLFFSLAVVGVTVFVVTFGARLSDRGGRSGPRRKKKGGAGGDGGPGHGPSGEEPVRLDLAGLFVFAGLAYLSTLARRNMALFALGTAPFVGWCLSTLGRRWLSVGPKPETRDRVAAAVGAALLPVLVVAAWFVASNNFYRWDGQRFEEFGPGIFEVGSPLKASAFVKEQQLPPPLYNDWISGGYLTWDRPVQGGVYIDPRGEVYDDQFIADYAARLTQPSRWQDEADHRGVQTVLLFHWWHRTLLNWLIRDGRWALVYFDENATVFVRRAGNEALIERATRAFEPLRERNVQALLAPATSWQWPVGQAGGLLAYGMLLDTMGRQEEAVRFFSQALDIGPSSRDESQLAVRLAQHHAARGDMERARAYLRRAARADPSNPNITLVRRRIGW